MRKLIEFIRSVYVVVLFVVLEIVAVSYYARSTPYTQARLLARSNEAIGGVQGLFADLRRYFTLGAENRRLVERVAELEERLAAYGEAETAVRLAEYMADDAPSKYRMTTASVVSNSVGLSQNLMVLDRGSLGGVTSRMGVLSPDGAVAGYVVDCTERYAVAMSILNTSFRVSGRLAGSDFSGLIYWDGVDQTCVVMSDVSKYADPQPGQEVVTSGFSQLFPPDVPIGRVESAELDETRTTFTVRVRLAAEIGRLRDVVVVDNRDREEIEALWTSDQVKQ